MKVGKDIYVTSLLIISLLIGIVIGQKYFYKTKVVTNTIHERELRLYNTDNLGMECVQIRKYTDNKFSGGNGVCCAQPDIFETEKGCSIGWLK